MEPRFHFRCAATIATIAVRFSLVAFLLSISLFVAAVVAARAQNSPTQPIGRIEGADVSVEGGTPARVPVADAIPSINVSNGSVVTVHSGKARLTLFGGGELDICGPAKFTMLASGDAITLALNFGRVHVQLPAKVSLRIFSPTIIATPIEISGGPRDVTVGLDLNDSLCVLATSGAIQLEHQFTGDKLIVPQAGEFFLNGGTLLPVAGKAGSCGCAPMEQHTAPRAPATIPEFARAVPSRPVVVPETPPAPAQAPKVAAERPAIEPMVQPGAVFVIPVRANDAHPIAPPAAHSAGKVPQIGEPLHGKITPALSFTASAPPPPDESGPEMMLLVHAARESPDWEFEGHVDAPGFAQAMQHALGEDPAATKKTPSVKPQTRPAKKKRGFWAALKGLFFGRVEADDSVAGVH